jgi:type I site-specific restriction endonuclease
MNKRDLSESDIKEKYITPAIIKAGWDDIAQIQWEEFFSAGRIHAKSKLIASGNTSGGLHTGGSKATTFTQNATIYACLDYLIWFKDFMDSKNPFKD